MALQDKISHSIHAWPQDWSYDFQPRTIASEYQILNNAQWETKYWRKGKILVDNAELCISNQPPQEAILVWQGYLWSAIKREFQRLSSTNMILHYNCFSDFTVDDAQAQWTISTAILPYYSNRCQIRKCILQ